MKTHVDEEERREEECRIFFDCNEVMCETEKWPQKTQ
jgi:hypothetical protein